MDTETIQKRGNSSRVVAVVGTVAVAALALFGWWVMSEKGAPVSTSDATTASISSEDLAAAARADVFLGHQSVGANLLEGIPAVYDRADVAAPPIVQDADSLPPGGSIAHTYLGENGDPLGKIEAFDELMRGGMADTVDVAAMKLCWLDFNPSTDVDAVFAAYRTTMDNLERDLPDVTFLRITTPLTTESSGVKATLKSLLRRPDLNAADNVARQRYNELMRQTYGDTGLLFDLAEIESTTPDGDRVRGEYQGDTYYALAPQYAADPGHLNADGSALAAAQFLALVSQVS